jgi:hypothetical protein
LCKKAAQVFLCKAKTCINNNQYKNLRERIMKTRTKLAALLMLLMVLSVPCSAFGQVTIGAGTPPTTGSVLDLQSNSKLGMLLPRLELTSTVSPAPLEGGRHVEGMTVYNTNRENDVDEGIYYNDGTKWIKIEQQSKAGEWFYMPSFNLPLSPAPATGLSFNLYEVYRRQFTRSGNEPQFVSSNTSAGTVTPQMYEADELNFFVTAYPTSVLKIHSISAAGVMSYDVLSPNVPEGGFINVVFVVK